MIESIGIEFLRESPIFWGFVVLWMWIVFQSITHVTDEEMNKVEHFINRRKW